MTQAHVTQTQGRPRWLGAESLTLTLTQGGRYAGEQTWQTQPEKGGYQTRVQTDFAGVLPASRRVQVSRYLTDFSSLSYAESDGRGKPTYETFFDEGAALITLRLNREEATSPLLTAHYDPISLVMALRSPDAPPQLWRAQLVGNAVHVQPLPDAEVSGVLARCYYLRPGGAYVACELEAPHRLLRLVQPSDIGPLEASLQPQARRKDAEKPDKPRRRRG